jgi:hypothetical protein
MLPVHCKMEEVIKESEEQKGIGKCMHVLVLTKPPCAD